MEVETERFDAITDDGEEVVVVIYQELLDTSSMSNPNSPPKLGLKRAVLSDGTPLNFKEDGVFAVFDTGELVTKV